MNDHKAPGHPDYDIPTMRLAMFIGNAVRAYKASIDDQVDAKQTANACAALIAGICVGGAAGLGQAAPEKNSRDTALSMFRKYAEVGDALIGDGPYSVAATLGLNIPNIEGATPADMDISRLFAASVNESALDDPETAVSSAYASILFNLIVTACGLSEIDDIPRTAIACGQGISAVALNVAGVPDDRVNHARTIILAAIKEAMEVENPTVQ